MRKALILAAVLLVFAISFNFTDSGITGFFVKAGVTGMAIAKEMVKSVLTFVLKMLG